MTDWGRDAMAAFAAARGLEFEDVGATLPTSTPLLAEGLGVGTHRASIVREVTDNSLTTIDGFTKRPERSTTNVCRGELPGGLLGQVCHHTRLIAGYRDEGDGGYTAVPATVVFAVLPSGSRALVDLQARPYDGPTMKVLGGSIDLSDGDAVIPHPTASAEANGWRFIVEPADDDAVVRAIAAQVGPYAAAAPPKTRIELRDGALCVAARGVITDAGALEGLCRLAAAVADAVARVVAGYAPLDPARGLPAPRDSPRARWLDQGVRTIDWPAPPPSVPAAVAAYADTVRAQARRQGGRIRRIALVAGGILLGLWVLIDLAVLALFGSPPVVLWIATIVSALILLPGLFGGARSVGADVIASHIGSRARPWGVEAFARGYAAARRMSLEDIDEFRQRFDSPLPGRPLKVLYDAIGLRLVLWLSRYELPPQHWLMAVLPAPATAPAPVDGYVVEVRGGCLVIAVQVGDDGRSGAALDTLAAAARDVAAAVRPSQPV